LLQGFDFFRSRFLLCDQVIETNTIKVSVSASIRSSIGQFLPRLVDTLVNYDRLPR